MKPDPSWETDISSPSQEILVLMGPENSLTFSRQPANKTYTEPDESSPRP